MTQTPTPNWLPELIAQQGATEETTGFFVRENPGEALKRISAEEYNRRRALLFANPLTAQVGGDHYKDMAIQPVQFIHANGIGYFEGNVIKYVARWRKKNGIADLEKARHYIDLLIKLETEHARKNS
jgi:hypothetical protein